MTDFEATLNEALNLYYLKEQEAKYYKNELEKNPTQIREEYERRLERYRDEVERDVFKLSKRQYEAYNKFKKQHSKETGHEDSFGIIKTGAYYWEVLQAVCGHCGKRAYLSCGEQE